MPQVGYVSVTYGPDLQAQVLPKDIEMPGDIFRLHLADPHKALFLDLLAHMLLDSDIAEGKHRCYCCRHKAVAFHASTNSLLGTVYISRGFPFCSLSTCESLALNKAGETMDELCRSLLQGTAGNPDMTKYSCASCGKADDCVLRCSRCKLAPYCSRHCQKAEWPRHKTVCQAAHE